MFTESIRDYSKNIPVTEKATPILWTLADSYSRTILKNIKHTPKSAAEISADTRIPISTVYRRVQALQDQKLVQISGSISKDGKKYFLYKSKIKSINAKFEDEIDVSITYR